MKTSFCAAAGLLASGLLVAPVVQAWEDMDPLTAQVNYGINSGSRVQTTTTAVPHD